MYKIALHLKANKEIEKLEKELRRRIKDKYDVYTAALAALPFENLCKKILEKFGHSEKDYEIISE